MIDSISIQGFKSIYNTPVPIELGRVNVFIGPNGSGKTNLLEAVGLMSAAASRRVDAGELARRGIRQGIPDLVRSSFKHRSPVDGITLRASSQLNTRSVSVELSQSSASESVWTIRGERTDRDGNLAEFTEQELLPFGHPDRATRVKSLGALDCESVLDTLQAYAIYDPSAGELQGTVPDLEQRGPVGLAGGRLANAVQALLNRKEGMFGSMEMADVLDLLDWVETFDVAEPTDKLLSPSVPSLRSVVRFTDKYMHAGANQLTGYDASEGALYALFMLVLAMHPDTPTFFAVENFDHALNPRLARRLVCTFTELILRTDPERQVLLTTHNPLVLDGLDLANDQVRLFVTERGSDGSTAFRRIAVSLEALEQVGGGFPVSWLWIMGRLGGVPDL